MSKPLKSNNASVSAAFLASYIFFAAFTVPNKYQYLYQSQSFFKDHKYLYWCNIHLHIYPQCVPLATHFNNTPSAKMSSTQTLKSSKCKLKRGEVSWQTVEQNAMQSYAAQGMKWLICDLGLSHKILWWRVRGRAWIVEKGRAWVSNRVCEKAVGAEEVLTTSQVGASQVTTSRSKKDWE